MMVSGALAGQIMIMYHHYPVPDPLRAASGPPRLRNGINRDFCGIFAGESEHGVVCKEITSMPCALTIPYIMCTVQATTHLGPH